MKPRLFPSNPILIVDDEPVMLRSYRLILRSGGITNIVSIEDAGKVMPLLAEQSIEAVLLDISMPHVTGDRLLEAITREFPAIPVIMLTGNDAVSMVVKCMKRGAFDYMEKPIENSRLISGVKHAVEIRQLDRQNRLLSRQLHSSEREEASDAFSEIITNNKSMHALFTYAEAVAASPAPVLITGETGTGKELMARAVHRCAGAQDPFVSVNIAGVDDAVFADTLFGHVKGAFTGADTPREGLIRKASGGTLFLDEIGDIKPESQTKLLRLLQEREYFVLGSDVPQRMDTRIIVATNCEMEALQASGRFRKDLYYRLSAHHIHIPSLNCRLDDLPLLLNTFLAQAAHIFKKPKPAFPPELITLLSNYPFPGNVRELKSMVFDAVCTHESKKLSMDVFKKHIRQNQAAGLRPNPETPRSDTGFEGFAALPSMADAQFLLMTEALRRSENNKSMAAEMLGISRQRLARHLKNWK